uniref:Uncharacterized protein n=1 Tax=Helianthus annuus TaxID=4232 RepID=A0A251UZ23_HELAN
MELELFWWNLKPKIIKISYHHLCFLAKFEISGRLWKNMFKWLSRTQAFVMSSVFSVMF